MPNTISLIKVGISHAVIIPAKWMRSRGVAPNTRFTIEETADGGLTLTPLINTNELTLPKASEKITIPKRLTSLFGTVTFTEEEIDSDPRIKHMLSR